MGARRDPGRAGRSDGVGWNNMSDATDEIVAAVGRIKGTLAEYSAGVDNKEARAEINAHLLVIQDRLSFGNDKVQSLREWAAVLYSRRRAQRWGGADIVRHFIRTDCASIEELALQLRLAAERNAIQKPE
jgi:hypothetical protein